MALADLISILSGAAVYVPLLSVITGGILGKLKVFLPDENLIENKTGIKREELFENIAKNYQALLNTSLKMPDKYNMRGDPPRKPDLLADHVTEFFRVFTIVREFDVIRRRIRTAYSVLFATTLLGILGVVLALVWDASRPVVAIVAVLAILTQLCAACFLRQQEARVKDLLRTI